MVVVDVQPSARPDGHIVCVAQHIGQAEAGRHASLQIRLQMSDVHAC
jgi:hypothetical protein